MHVLSSHPSLFQVQVHPERSRVLVAVGGELDCATAPRLADEVDQLRAVGWDAIALDLRDLSFIDSAGLHLLLDVDSRAREEGWRFELEGECPSLERLLQLTGLENRFARG